MLCAPPHHTHRQSGRDAGQIRLYRKQSERADGDADQEQGCPLTICDCLGIADRPWRPSSLDRGSPNSIDAPIWPLRALPEPLAGLRSRLRDGEGYVTRRIRRRCGGRNGHCARGLQRHARLDAVDAGLDVLQFVVRTPVADAPFRIRSARRRCPHHPRPNVFYALRAGCTFRKPADHDHQGGLCSADDSGRGCGAARAFVLGKSAGHPDAESGASGFASGGATAEADPQAEAAQNVGAYADRSQDDATAGRGNRQPVPGASAGAAAGGALALPASAGNPAVRCGRTPRRSRETEECRQCARTAAPITGRPGLHSALSCLSQVGRKAAPAA